MPNLWNPTTWMPVWAMRSRISESPPDEYINDVPFLPVAGQCHLDELLASAVILSWSDLMPETTSGIIHIECHVDRLGSVEFLTVWASVLRDDWKLVSEHWMRWDASHGNGIFSNKRYRSGALDDRLGMLMKYQNELPPGPTAGRDRLIVVKPPSGADADTAGNAMRVFLDRIARKGVPNNLSA
jgi:hypothetical protein